MSIIDSDGHVMESDSDILSFLPSKYRGDKSLLAFPFWPTLDGWQRAACRVYDGKKRVMEQPSSAIWQELAAHENLEHIVLYPTAGLAHGLIAGAEWSRVLAEGYNNWVHARFVQRNSARFSFVALLPLQDVDASCAELRRAVTTLGAVGACLTAANAPSLPLLGDERYFKLYEEACRLNCMIGVHGAATIGLGLEQLDDFAAVRALSHPFAQMRQFASMMVGGVFERFPTLRTVFLEAGVGWVPFMLDRLDAEWQKRRTRIVLSPSEQVQKGSVYFGCELEESLLPAVIERVGQDRIVGASDYPHETPIDVHHALQSFHRRTDISAESRAAILRDNAMKLYDLGLRGVASNLTAPAAAARNR